MSLMHILRKNQSNYSKTEEKIANYIIGNFKEVPFLTIFDIANESNVSPTSVTRFVNKYFDLSFQETKVFLSKEISELNNNNQVSTVLSWADNLEALPEKLVSEINKTFNDVLLTADLVILRKAIKCINEARIVYLLGVGSSSIYAIELQQKLLKIGIVASYHLENNLNMMNIANSTSEDVIIAFSYMGRTKEVNQAIRNAKKSKVKVITITSVLNSNLTDISNLVIQIPSFEDNKLRLSSIFSRYGNFLIIDCLFIELAKLRIDDPKTFANGYQQLIRGLKEDDID